MRKPFSFLFRLATVALVALAALSSQSCSKHNDTVNIQTGSVFVAGDDGDNPILWVDGKARQLASNGGFGAQVLLSGNDVYVAGTSGEGNPGTRNTPAGPSGQYGYWKNGIETPIGAPRFLESPVAMTVNGGDVYFSIRQLYQNGSAVALQGLGGTGFVCAAQTVGADVYLAGRDSLGNGVYWKNGVMHEIAATQPLGSGIQIYCMYVLNGDVYVGGSDLQLRGAIWKNGVEKVMSGSVWDVVAVFVDGSDVYSISHVPGGSGNIPAYFKNGVQVSLPLNGATSGNATSIFVSGGDVYVTGTTSNGAVLWKNGVGTVLSSSTNAEALSVVVR